MSKKKYFGEGVFLTAASYFLFFLSSTIYFYICNLPLILLYIVPYGFNVTPESKYILIPLLLTVAPALTALYGTMGKIVKYGDIKIFKDYFKAYKAGFKQSIILWCIGSIILTVAVTDISFFSKMTFGYFVLIIFAIIICITIIGALYVFPIISQFKLKIKDILRLAIFFAVVRFQYTLIIIVTFFIGLFIFGLSPIFTLAFFPSIFCYLCMRILKPVFTEIEGKIIT